MITQISLYLDHDILMLMIIDVGVPSVYFRSKNPFDNPNSPNLEENL